MDFPASAINLAVGGGLFYGILKFFYAVEEVLTADTKKNIADWLRRLDTSRTSPNWPQTFTHVFDRIFGTKHMSWRCFWRSCLASTVVFVLFSVVQMLTSDLMDAPLGVLVGVLGFLILIAIPVGILCNVLPDYVSLLETRLMLKYMI